MIYIRTHYDQLCETSSIVGVYQVPCKNAEEQYKLFMIEKAKEINLEINPHWLNALDYTKFNSHLSKPEFNKKLKEWSKIRRKWNISKYICEILKGVKLDYAVFSF